VLELLLALGLLWIVLAVLVGITVGRAAALGERRDRSISRVVPMSRYRARVRALDGHRRHGAWSPWRSPRRPGGGDAA
jgi:hypothetical protein